MLRPMLVAASLLATGTLTLLAAPLTDPRPNRDQILEVFSRSDRAAEKRDWKTLFACSTEDHLRESVQQFELVTCLIYVFASIAVEGKQAPPPEALKRKAAAGTLLEYAANQSQLDEAACKRRMKIMNDPSLTATKRRQLRLAFSRDRYRGGQVEDLYVRFIQFLLAEGKKSEDPPAQKLLHLHVAGDRATAQFVVDTKGKMNTYELRRIEGRWRIDEGPKEDNLFEEGLKTAVAEAEGEAP
jgi:hypothetical protein